MANYHWKMLQEIGRVEKELHALWIGNLSKQQKQRIYDATKSGQLIPFTSPATPRGVRYVDIDALLDYNARERAYGRPQIRGLDVHIISGNYKYKAAVEKRDGKYAVLVTDIDEESLLKKIWLKVYFKGALLYRTIIERDTIQGDQLVCAPQVQQELEKVLIGRI